MNYFEPREIMPRTIKEAVERITRELPLKDKAAIAKMDEKDLIQLHLSLGQHIRNEFGLWSGNKALLEDCHYYTGEEDIHEDSASYVIIKELWERLRENYVIRLVK